MLKPGNLLLISLRDLDKELFGLLLLTEKDGIYHNAIHIDEDSTSKFADYIIMNSDITLVCE